MTHFLAEFLAFFVVVWHVVRTFSDKKSCFASVFLCIFKVAVPVVDTLTGTAPACASYSYVKALPGAVSVRVLMPSATESRVTCGLPAVSQSVNLSGISAKIPFHWIKQSFYLFHNTLNLNVILYVVPPPRRLHFNLYPLQKYVPTSVLVSIVLKMWPLNHAFLTWINACRIAACPVCRRVPVRQPSHLRWRSHAGRFAKGRLSRCKRPPFAM